MADRGGSAAAGAKNWPRIGAQGRGQSTGVCFAEGVSVAGQIRSAGNGSTVGAKKSPARAGLRCDLMEEHTRSRGSKVPQWNFTEGTRKGKAAKEKPRVRERGRVKGDAMGDAPHGARILRENSGPIR